MEKPVSRPAAHVLALITILIWGTTFIASKQILTTYTPIQTMLMRFIVAYTLLWVLHPHLPKTTVKNEIAFFFMGIFGNSLYYLCENTALIYAYASSVSIIISSAPIFTAILAHFFTNDEKIHKLMIFGSLFAFFGVILVIFNGTVIWHLSPLGDFLALAGSLCWATYSVILRHHTLNYNSFFLARRVMLWGIITGLPMAAIEGVPFTIAPLFSSPLLLFCLLFLAVLGSAFCYIFWNKAVFSLGVVTTNNYIFLNPFITVVAAAILLKEPISIMGIVGALMIIGGILIANHKK